MSGEHVVVNPLLQAMRAQEERKKAREIERMRRRKLRAERRARARAGSGSNGRTSKRNSSQLPLPIPSYEELAKTMPRTNSDESLPKSKLGLPPTRVPVRAGTDIRPGENGPVAGPSGLAKTIHVKTDARNGEAMKRSSELSRTCSSELTEEEIDDNSHRLSSSGEQWIHLKEETGLYYLDEDALDVLQKWLIELRLPVDEYLKMFLSQGFDNLQTIALLKEEDIAEIGVTKIGHRKKIMFWAQNHRPPHWQELMANPEYDWNEDDEDLCRMNSFTSWIDYNHNSNNSTPTRPNPNPNPSNASNPTSPRSPTPTTSPVSPISPRTVHTSPPQAKPKPKG